MFTLRHIVALMIAVITATTTLSAQTPNLGGSYEITHLDGSPLKEGVEFTTEITARGNGDLDGDVSMDDGSGPVALPKEHIVITCIEEGFYFWVSDKGGAGVIEWNADEERYESTVLSGPHKGKQRALNQTC